MKKILLISDTHGYIDEKIIKYANKVDEIWHAGDFGYSNSIKKFMQNHKVRGVYGNIDGQEIRKLYPKIAKFPMNFSIDFKVT